MLDYCADNGGRFISRGNLVLSLLLLLTTLLALSWNFEEPSSLNTITVLLLVFGFGTFSIRRARRTGIVISEVEWMTMFFVKIVVSFLITKYLWTLPVASLLKSGS